MLSIGAGERRREMSGEEGMVRVVGVSGMWGQGFRVRWLFVKRHRVVRGRVRSVGWVRVR